MLVLVNDSDLPDPRPLVKRVLKATCPTRNLHVLSVLDYQMGLFFKPSFSEMGSLLIFFHIVVSLPLNNDDDNELI